MQQLQVPCRNKHGPTLPIPLEAIKLAAIDSKNPSCIHPGSSLEGHRMGPTHAKMYPPSKYSVELCTVLKTLDCVLKGWQYNIAACRAIFLTVL